MATSAEAQVQRFLHGLERRNPGEPEFYQAVEEFVQVVIPFTLDNPKYQQDAILERMTEPDRVIIFRVTWEDDAGNIRVNRAWRVQFNNSIGPYKGGMRFHRDVSLSVLKFLGFEQVFKNSLTTLPMGGAKGGSNFNPKDKSPREVMRFCQSLMVELHRHIGEDTDVPAGDIGVGAREISYMFGMYKRLNNRSGQRERQGKGRWHLDRQRALLRWKRRPNRGDRLRCSLLFAGDARPPVGWNSGQDGRRIWFGERRALRHGEADRPRRKRVDGVRLKRVHP